MRSILSIRQLILRLIFKKIGTISQETVDGAFLLQFKIGSNAYFQYKSSYYYYLLIQEVVTMKVHRTYGSHMKHFFLSLAIVSSLFLTACGSADTAGTQARTDLTADHVRGLYSGMVRSDVEDLLGTGDKSLADHESIEVYSLSDGTTALLRYRDDTLMDAYLRDKDNIETSIFGQNASNMSGVNGVNDTNNSYTETNMGYEESGESRERR